MATGTCRVFPLTRSAAAGDLVGHRRHGHLKQVAEGVGLAAVIAQRDDAGRADRGVGLAGPPGPAHGVGDDHADAGPAPLPQPLAQLAGRAVGILRQQHDGAGGGVRGVHPGRRQHQPVPGLGDRGRAAPGDDPGCLRLDGLLPAGPDHPPLGLADDL